MNGWDLIGLRRLGNVVPVFLVAVFALLLGVAAPGGWAEDDDCGNGVGPAVPLPATKLFIEHNATDEDTGVHGLFDGVNWVKLCVYDPAGRQILEVEPTRQLRTQALSGIFFESAEPPNDEVPIAEILSRFPAGQYAVRGLTADGEPITGAATFTHTIPAGPKILHPLDDAVVAASNLVVRWKHVTKTITGQPFTRTGYQVIITKDVPGDPHGFSRPTFDVHVPPNVTSLTVPNQFLQPGTRYELEVLVLEVSGNQTLSSLFFETQ